MKIKSFHKTSLCQYSSRLTLRKTTVIGLSLSCALATGCAYAQAWSVTDMKSNTANFLKTTAQYGKEVAHYKSVIDHYTQQLVQLEHMNFTLPQMQDTFTEVDPQAGMEETCPGSGGGIQGAISGMLQVFTPDMSKPITEQQLQVCQQIVMRQNDKYNLMVKMVNRIKTQYQPNASSIFGQAAAIGDVQGKSDGTKTNAEVNSVALDTEMAGWKGQIDTDDQIINILQLQQGMLAKKALKGSNTILGNVVQAATFAKAFD